MSNAITIDDFYKLFQESERQRQETERILRESLERAQEAAVESRADFDRRMAEADRRATESRADFDRRMTESKAEADRRAVEAEERLARAEAIAAQANESVNNLGSRWGRFVENMVAPGVLRLFQDRGVAVEEVYQRVRSKRGGRHLEIDILAVDDDVAVIVEVKSRLTQDSVRRCLQIMEQFKTAFPHYASYQLYGAVAAIEIDGEVDIYAYNQGLFVIQQSGDSVEISNPADFTPRIW